MKKISSISNLFNILMIEKNDDNDDDDDEIMRVGTKINKEEDQKRRKKNFRLLCVSGKW